MYIEKKREHTEVMVQFTICSDIYRAFFLPCLNFFFSDQENQRDKLPHRRNKTNYVIVKTAFVK